MGRMKTYGNKDIAHDYFQWLCELLCVSFPDGDYYLLFQDLFNKEFVWVVENDENRYFDAINLRREAHFSRYGAKINVLEVLATLAIHMDDILYEEGGIEKPERWFWEMMDNLGVSDYNDENYNADKIDEILENWLNRDWKTPIKKRVFPVQKVGVGKKEPELWYLMQQYIDENYNFD